MESQLMEVYSAANQMEPLEQLAPYLRGLNSTTVDSFAQLADQILLSAPSSPAPSDQSYSYSSSSSSYFSSCCSSSSGPASVASSYETSDSPAKSRSRRKVSTPKRGQKAAEKYRQKLKGRDQSLVEQMEREQERNELLKAQINSKLALYREFVNLLATNLNHQDSQLASLGSGSLSRIMGEVTQQETRRELELQLANFQRILQLEQRQPMDREEELLGPPDDLVYDFYTDTFTDSFAIAGRQPALVS